MKLWNNIYCQTRRSRPAVNSPFFFPSLHYINVHKKKFIIACAWPVRLRAPQQQHMTYKKVTMPMDIWVHASISLMLTWLSWIMASLFCTVITWKVTLCTVCKCACKHKALSKPQPQWEEGSLNSCSIQS